MLCARLQVGGVFYAYSNTPSIRTLSTILKNGQDKAQEQKPHKEPVQHGITRGADYFRKGGSSR